MEVIKKKICLEDFICRTPIPTENLSVVNSGATNTWGEIPIKLISFNGKSVKYGTLMKCYFYLNNIMHNSTYYTYKKYKENDVYTNMWVDNNYTWKDIMDNNYFKGFYNSTQDYENLNPDITPNTIIGLTDQTLIDTSAITTTVGDIDTSGITKIIKDINLFLNKNIVPYHIDGMFTPSYVYYAEKDRILNFLNKIKPSTDNTNCCVLKNYNDYGGDEFYNWVSGLCLTSSTIIQEESGSANTIDIPILLTSKFSDLGQVKTYDVTIIEEGEEKEITATANTVNPLVVSISGESKLRTLRKRKKNYDDDGNELPDMFVYSASTTNISFESGYTVNYIKNVQSINDDFYGDLITNINSTETGVTFTYVIGGKLDLDAEGKLKLNDEEVNLFNDTGSTSSVGIWYQETFSLKDDKIEECFINGNKIAINYKTIDFASKEETISHYGIDFPRKNYILCNDIRYVSDSYIKDATNNFIFRDEKNLGLNYPLKEEYDVAIDRGMSSAFERHLQLGEVKTWDDLEKYRNGSLLNN